MKAIAKKFKTLKQAERFQNKLYDKYEQVKLVAWPGFQEEGWYTWNVKKKA